MSRLWHWLLAPGDAAAPASPALEELGPVKLPYSLGEELLAATPERARYRISIRDLIGDFDRAQKRELVDRVLVRFALWVVDLPASERHHDARPGGRLDHSLKVTHAVVQALSSSTLRLSYDPVEDTRERPFWIYAGFVGALLHDAGELFDVEVSSPDRKETWNPQAEPLAAFLGRRGLKTIPREFCRILPGPGLKAVQGRSPIFQSLILPPSANAYLGKRLSFVTEASVEAAQGELPPHIPEAARQVAALIRTWEKKLATDARGGAPTVAPSGPRPGFVVAPGPQAAPSPRGVEVQALATPAPDTLPCREEPRMASTLPKTPLPDPRVAQEPPPTPAPEPASLVIPGKDFWGCSPKALEKGLSAARLLFVLGRLVVAGRLSAKGESARVFIRPDFAWFSFPAALEKVAEDEDFSCRPDLRKKMLDLLERAGWLRPFGPDRQLAEVIPDPTAKRTMQVFRIPTSVLLDEANRAGFDHWPHEIEIRTADAGTVPGKESGA
jgi:hypothetical protein